MASPKLPRLQAVDLLRGLAIFFVLMNHVNMRLRLAKIPYAQGLPPQLVSFFIWNGQLGVQIFFAISGFLITSTALRRWGTLQQVSIPGFYRLRFARIAPLLLALLAILSALHFAHVKNFIVGEKTGGLGRALLAALTFHINWLEATRGYLPANWDILWSLSVEEMFYLFFPLVCRFRKLFFALLLTFVALGPFGRTVLAHGNGTWEEYSYLGGMEGIALGCLTALLVARTGFSAFTLRALAATGLMLLAFILAFIRQPYLRKLSDTGLDMTILGLGTCMVIVAAAQTEWQSPSFLSPLLKLGQNSYEIYLTHMFVVFAFFELFLAAGKPMPAVPFMFAAVVLVAAFLGAAVAKYYSEPMNRKLRRGSKQHAAVAAAA
jgi:peptidoglycan/LPS O-acetylase OafA/YrhL